MIKLVLTDMDDTLIPAGRNGASDYAIEGIHAMQAAGLHFGPVSGRQPSAMGWMFKIVPSAIRPAHSVTARSCLSTARRSPRVRPIATH